MKDKKEYNVYGKIIINLDVDIEAVSEESAKQQVIEEALEYHRIKFIKNFELDIHTIEYVDDDTED